jgi:hypothetical protein
LLRVRREGASRAAGAGPGITLIRTSLQIRASL